MTIEIFILLMKKDTSQQVAFHTWFSLLLIPIISILIWKQRKRVDGLFMWNRLRSVALDDVNQSTFVQWSQSDGGLFTLLPSVECSDGIWSSRCSGEMKTLSHSFFANNSVWKWQHWKCFCFCQLKKNVTVLRLSCWTLRPWPWANIVIYSSNISAWHGFSAVSPLGSSLPPCAVC